MTLSVSLRIMGSVLVVLSYFVILHISPTLGVIGNIIGDSITLFYFVEVKAWDVIMMVAVMNIISLSKLLS